MGFRIQNNIAAMNAQRNLGISDSNLSKSLEKLSSGFRINRAADDTAGLAISQQMRADITSYKVASRNVSEANSLLQVAEGAMDQIGNMLTRLKELATQAASANANSNLQKINAEGNSLINEMDRIASSAEYAGTKLVDGTFGVSVNATAAVSTFTSAKGFANVTGLQSAQTYNIAVAASGAGEHDITASATLANGQRYTETVYDVDAVTGSNTAEVKFATLGLTLTLNNNVSSTAGSNSGQLVARTAVASDFQVGSKNTGNDRIGISLEGIKATGTTGNGGTGLGLALGSMSSAGAAQTFMATVDTAINELNRKRGDVGATQNRLGYASATLSTTIENTTAAESVIRDADMASEMTTLSKNQILLQAGTAMLAQANQAPQQLLKLFQ